MDLASLALQFPHEGLAYYAMVGDEAGARGLLDAGLVQDIDWRDDNGFTALVLAAANGHSSIVDLLLERGAEVDASPESTAMMIAVANAHAHVVPHLIRGGADVLCKDINGLTAFAQACNAGQIEVVITMVETLQALGANDTVMTLVETSADVGLTLLILAASNDHLEIVMYLIELGADVHRQNDQAFDALLGAAQYGSSDVVQYLLGSGANVETMNSSRETPLILASAQGHVDVVDILLGAGADVNHKTANGQCALHHCVMNGHAEIASRLIRAGTDVMMERNDGCTSFFLACKDGMTSVVKAMLEAVGDMGDPGVMAAMVNTTRLDGTALIAASHYGHLDIVKLLVAYGVNVQATNANGEDALRIAVEANQLDTVQYLLANGGTSDSRNASNRTPLMYASATGNVEMVHALIDGEAQTNLIDGVDARTALWKAACDGHCDIIDCLLEAHADIDFQDARGYTPLMAAAVNGHDAAVALLVQRQAGLDLRDLVGATALFYAATKGHTAIVRILLEAGADHRHELSPPANGNALHHASQHGHEDVVQALIHHGADVNTTTTIGLTALMASATKGHAEISLLLLRNGAEVDAQDVNGMTAMHFAVISRSVDTIRALIQAGASARIKDKAGSSPLYQALLMGEFELVTLLEETVSSSTLDEDITSAVWPIRTLYELYDRADTEWRSEGPSWYIDASVIEEASLARQQILPTAVVKDGRWLGSKVTLIKPSFGASIEIEHLTSKKHVSKEMFAAAVLRWFPLSHPHVLKLFGANHRNQQFLVAEHSQGTLRSYLKARPHRTWRTLHQIALGLQYLHERAIIHGNIHGDIISFSEDGLPKIGGLGIFDATNVSSSRLNWWSPESLSDTEITYETDIYSFGMLIIEAISGDVPYAAEVEAGADIKKLIMEYRIPTRHEAFSDRGWELVKRLTMGLPTERLSVDALVLELEDLATEEEQQLVSIIAPTPLDQVKLRFEQAQVLTSLHSDAVHLSLLEQLREIMQGLQVLQKSERKPAVMSRCLAVVDRFILHLEARSALSTAQTHSSGRQHAAKIKSLFNDVERLVDELHSVRPFKERGWREVWNQWSTEQQRKFGVELEAVTQYVPQSKPEEAHIEQLSCMLFEITKHRSRYGAISDEITKNATTKIIDILGGPLPDWFFPWYEVVLATSKPFSKGGFGEVYRGKWMGSDVVVKKCIAFDQKVFVREVELWFKLDHPHVVKLFGACHVGQKFFVAEWAEYGQLDTYLARKKKLGRSVMWQKLHEAALGLRYLHVRGIIHRDLKCNNILVGRDEKARITDFGLSSSSEQSDDVVVTQTFGNVRWAAPEVLAGGMPSYASDVFSFGMSIVEAVTGRVPYAETRDGSVVAASVAAGDFLARPRCFERDDHWTLVTRCCAFDPAERVDMDEVIATLSIFADEEVHRHHNEIPCGSKSESVVGEPEMILELTNEESMLVSKASRRDSQGVPANDLSTILTSMREVGEVDIGPESPDLFISDASRRESHALEAGDRESSHGWSGMSHIYEAQSSMAEVEEDGLSGATVYYSAWSCVEKPKARDIDSNASTASTSTASTSLDSPSASGA